MRKIGQQDIGNYVSYGAKCNENKRVTHSNTADKFCDYLDTNPDAESYDVNVLLKSDVLGEIDKNRLKHIGTRDQFSTDVLIYKTDGSTHVREVCRVIDLDSINEIERFELSRRYWEKMNVSSWGIITEKKDGLV